MGVSCLESWQEIELHEVAEIVTGKTPSKKRPDFFNGDIPFIKPADVNNQGTILHVSETISELGAQTVPTVPENSIVVTCIGNLGRVAITAEKSATNQQINSVVPFTGINTRYLYYQVLTLQSWLESESSATTVSIINKTKFSKAPLKLASLDEQKVIADKLDSLLAQVETIKARLDRVPDILKRFRQSVLAAAVSGRLTEEWRSNNDTSNIKSLVDQHIAGKKGLLKVSGKSAWDSDLDLYELPENWEWIENHKLSQDTQSAICAGPFGTIFKSKDFRETGVPIVFLRHVKQGGFNQNKPKYMDKKVWDEFHQPYSIYGGELLITKLGEPPGECCVYPEDQGVAMVTPDVLKMDTDEVLVDKNYLKHFFNSPISKKMVGDAAFGATRLRIDIPLFKKFPIPLPPRNEQTEIVLRVEELFDFADAVEQKAQAATERVNKLTQSILAKAFRGELTVDWRAANPDLISGENSAEALLEKIKAEREALKPKKKREPRR